MTEDTLPDGWQEANDTDRDAGRYNPQPIDRYEHESGIGLRLTPSEPTAGTASSGKAGNGNDEEYLVGVGIDGIADPEDMHTLASATDHADAIGTAREFMRTYNDQCVENNEDPETVIDGFAESN